MARCSSPAQLKIPVHAYQTVSALNKAHNDQIIVIRGRIDGLKREKQIRNAGFFVLWIAERDQPSSGLVYGLEGYEVRRAVYGELPKIKKHVAHLTRNLYNRLKSLTIALSLRESRSVITRGNMTKLSSRSLLPTE